MQKIELYSSLDSPVLIQGADGNDFESIATVIHENSSRGKRRLINVNCEGSNGITNEIFDKAGTHRFKGNFSLENFNSFNLNSRNLVLSARNPDATLSQQTPHHLYN